MSHPSTTHATLPEMEHVAELLARLYPQRADLEPRGSAIAGLWARADGQSIAGAVGLYAQDRPKRRFPAALLMLRCWPDGLSYSQRQSLLATTSAVLARRIPARWAVLCTTVAASLLAEFRTPARCWKCQGRGAIGSPPAICPQCLGTKEGPRGTPTRAADAGVSRHTWQAYLQEPYEQTLHGFRYLADHAARGVLDKLGG